MRLLLNFTVYRHKAGDTTSIGGNSILKQISLIAMAFSCICVLHAQEETYTTSNPDKNILVTCKPGLALYSIKPLIQMINCAI